MRRILNRLYYFAETLLQKGFAYQLAGIAVILGLLSLSGGLTVWLFAPTITGLGEGTWWAFLRLSDPGYLGDDTGTLRIVVSTIMTISGYVFFLGALVAVLSNRLNEFMDDLASGLSPIFEEDHILIIGWNARIHSLVEEIGHAEERVKRHLDRRRLPAVVVLTRDYDETLIDELDERLDPSIRKKTRVLIRAGNPLEAESLERVDFTRASSIILVSSTESGKHRRHLSDIQLIKILLSLRAQSRTERGADFPNVVLEIGNPANKQLAERAGWTDKTEAIANDEFISRLVAHTIRHPGLTGVYNHLLTDTFGESIYLRPADELGIAGQTLGDLVTASTRTIPIGVLRPASGSVARERRLRLLNPRQTVSPEDEVIFIAPSLDAFTNDRTTDTLPDGDDTARPVADDFAEALDPETHDNTQPERRLMFVGWSHLLNPIIHELDAFEHAHFHITIVSRLEDEACRDRLRIDFSRLDNLTVRCQKATIDHPEAVDNLHPERLDNIILLSSELTDGPLMADAESIMAFVQLRDHFRDENETSPPSFVIELNDEDNRDLFQFGTEHDVIMTQEIVSHLLSQVAMRRALAWVYEELFTQRGPEIRFAAVTNVLADTARDRVAFQDIQQACLARGAIAIGLHSGPGSATASSGLRLNPDPSFSVPLRPESRVVVISNA